MKLPGKPLDGGTLTMVVPSSWSWRLKLGELLIRLACWVLGLRFVRETHKMPRRTASNDPVRAYNARDLPPHDGGKKLITSAARDARLGDSTAAP